jgi:hypothetical protein
VPDLKVGITNVAFSDESHWNVGRYRSIGLITLPIANEQLVEKAINDQLCKSGIKEFKWAGLQSSNERDGAIELLKKIVGYSNQGLLRADILQWDISDHRHDIPGRDDTLNLGIMYYHILENVLKKRWPDGGVWLLCPDEHSSIDWQTLNDCVTAKGKGSFKIEKDPFSKNILIGLSGTYDVAQLKQVNSYCNKIVQLADLLAGMAVYSRERYDVFHQWREDNDEQMKLFALESKIAISSSDKERCKVLYEFDRLCKHKKLGVSLKTHKGLRTINPENPINFWWYEPQSELDKAPT